MNCKSIPVSVALDEELIDVSDRGIFRVPPSYLPATWRNVTPVNDVAAVIGVGFDVVGGSAIRLRLSVEHARHLSDAIAEYLRDHDTRVQPTVS
jgi:hypothetical protein